MNMATVQAVQGYIYMHVMFLPGSVRETKKNILISKINVHWTVQNSILFISLSPSSNPSSKVIFSLWPSHNSIDLSPCGIQFSPIMYICECVCACAAFMRVCLCERDIDAWKFSCGKGGGGGGGMVIVVVVFLC